MDILILLYMQQPVKKHVFFAVFLLCDVSWTFSSYLRSFVNPLLKASRFVEDVIEGGNLGFDGKYNKTIKKKSVPIPATVKKNN